MPKKVLIISLTYFPKYVGGAEIAVQEITDRIPSHDITFDMVTLRFDRNLPKVEKNGNVTIYRIGFTKNNPGIADLKKFPLVFNKLWFQFAAAGKAISLHKKNHYDAIWAIMAHSSGVPAALFKQKYPEVPYILTLQEGDPPEYIERKMRVFGPWFRRAFTSTDKVQAISTFLGKWATRMGYKKKVEVIPNAAEGELFAAPVNDSEIQEIRKNWGIGETDTVLITASRLVHKNANDEVIRVLGKLPSSVHFVICGIGPDEEKLRVLAKETGVESRVHFLGEVSHAHLPKYLKASTIFIRPSRSEGMGNSFIEAMAAGIPVIATQAGGIADFLFDLERNPGKPATGFAVDVNSPEQIAEKVIWILEHPIEVNEVVKNAKTMALENYDWNLIARRMKEEVFTPLLTGK